jgi:ribonuclease R
LGKAGRTVLSDTSILRRIERQPKQAAGFKQLVRELGVHGEERRELALRLAALVHRGELVEGPREHYSLPRSPAGANLLAGRLSRHRDGFGFVTPESGPAKERVTGDVFINPQAIGNAMHGDRVMVELTAARHDGRAEGRIVKVVGRAHPTVVGTFHYGSRHNYVVPIDERVAQDVIVPRGMEVPEEFTLAEARGLSRHRVLGEEAARREQPAWDDLEGVVVDLEITEWPTPTQNPRGRVIEILGYEDDFGVDVEIIIRKYHLPHRFPAEVLEEAQQIPQTISARELASRRDFRSLPVVTIDGETARDFDDAVWVRRLENGNYQLQVHIADVANYVTAGSALDEEARLRGTSVYFPDRAVPMLPAELSTDLCSLRPNLDRLVLSCLMEIDHQGEVLGYEICEGVIRSAHRMTYTSVNAIFEGDPVLRRHYAARVEDFLLMRELALILNRKRERRGAIDFDLPEPEIEFDEHGLMKAIAPSERNFAHRVIEEFMLAANECVAGYLESKGIAALYRVHDKPEARKVLEFEQMAAGFGYSLGVGAIPVRRFHYSDDRRPRRREGRGDHGGQQRREIELPEDVHVTPFMYQKLAKRIAGTPEERILSYLMLRSLKQARYSEENIGHFALAAPVYTHFTSPIRRYPDLIVHRILKEVLRDSSEDEERGEHGVIPVGRGVPSAHVSPASLRQRGAHDGTGRSRSSADRKGAKHKAEAEIEVVPLRELHEIAGDSSDTERRADDAERELMEWKKAKFMADRIGEDFAGLIVNVTKFGFFVELTEMFIEGLVPLSSLTDDRYFYHENTRQISAQHSRKTFSIGDRVRVLVDRIDPVQKKIQFALIPEEKPRAASSPGVGKRKRK